MNLSVFHSNLSTVFSSVAPNNITSTSINVASDTEEAIATTTTNLRTRTTQETTTVLTRTTFITAAATLKTTNFVGHPFQNDNHWIRAGDRTPSEDNLETENEMGLLWLPYVIFTVVLLGLIAMSFVRFHCQRGDQYRRRRSELEDKEPTGNGQSMLAASYQPNGGSAAVPDKPVRCGDVPEHMVLFLQFTETETPSGTGSGSQDDQWTETKRLCATQRVFGGFKAQSKVPSVDTALGGGVSGDGGGGGKQQRVTCHRRPLTFTFNINGSMVDIRCSDEERTKTFHLSTGAGKVIGGQGVGKQTAAALEMVDPSGDGFCLSAAVGDEEDGRRCSGNKLEEPRAATTTTTTTTLSSSSRRSSSNKVQGCVRGIGGTGGGGGGGGEAKGGGRGLGYGTGGAVISQQHKVLMYSTSTTETCDLRQNSSSADEALFLLHPSRS